MPQEHHQLIEKSFQQLSNITVADNIICDSQENLKTLQNLNLCKHAKVMPLAIINNFIPPPVSKLSSKDSIIRIIFIGRLVKSKGPLDLLSALKKVLESGQKSPIQLDFVSNSSFADKDLLIQIQNNCQALQKLYKNQLKITFHFDATETLKYKLLHEADLFVLPSYHEGFCVPILEALYSGCSVISYNNSNIPNISSNFAILVETGNIYSLYSAINNKIEEIKKNQRSGDYSSYERYIRDTNLYLENFHIEKINKNYIEYIDEILV
jgi:glycosyltransferase involved in cell wall biosynthesis